MARHGFSFGVTNPGGKNFKTIIDHKGNVVKEPIGTVSIFTGDSWEMFEAQRSQNNLEYVHHSEMSPAEQAMIRNLENVNSISFPIPRFRTINSMKTMLNRRKGHNEPEIIDNEDVGAMNVFLYLGKDPKLGKIIHQERSGIERARKINDRRVEAKIEGNWTKQLFATS